jgi:DNA repair protein RadA/Sms
MPKAGGSAPRTIYICQQCGKESLKWLGRCPQCQEWNSLVEKVVTKEKPVRPVSSFNNMPEELSRIVTTTHERFSLPLPEFNRVLGGGLVPGSLVLIGGDPGIGKSTLILQVAAMMASPESPVLYVSGEETKRQIKLRAERLGIRGEELFLLSESDLNAIISQIDELKPRLAIVDSIQSVYLPELEGISGSITQVRECTLRLMHEAKASDVPIIIAGHVTKEGTIAGPKVLEHIVDVVIYLEGEPFSNFRILHCVKNRFGSTNEVGVFEMKEEGLMEVDNPSVVFLSEREIGAVGSVVVPVLEGNRPLLVEIQALTNPTSFGLPRRTANGVDFGRLLLITAVLSRRIGIRLGNQDIIVNATGGLKVKEPAADLAAALAIVSSMRDSPLDAETVAIGEVGLSGELRSVPYLDRRVNEAARIGFKRAIIPRSGIKNLIAPNGLELRHASTLREAIRLAWGDAKTVRR